MKLKLLLSLLLTWFCLNLGNTQTNAPSIQSGVTFQWSDTQTVSTDPATIESITVNGNVYFNFGVPTGYELTQAMPQITFRSMVLMLKQRVLVQHGMQQH